MSQLERLRHKEVNKIKYKIVKAKKVNAKKILTLEKQRHLMEAQISTLQASFPKIQEEFQRQEDELKAKVVEIDLLKMNSQKEREIIQSLKSAQKENPFSGSNPRKLQLLAELIQAQET